MCKDNNPITDYEQLLDEELKDPSTAASHIQSAINDTTSPTQSRQILITIEDVARAKGLSWEQLREKAGFSKKDLTDIISEIRSMTIIELARILDALDMKMVIQPGVEGDDRLSTALFPKQLRQPDKE
ncbi:MAG: hypothetical protein D6719_06025 [Candidatus Dadabacteria bacterium]|nr:MAG: hypothetical protein D6719_06025 [Candidatus Dadabacteria bacterium]